MRRITSLQVTLQHQNHTEKITFSTPCVRSRKAVLPSFAKNLKVHLFIDHLAHSSSSITYSSAGIELPLRYYFFTLHTVSPEKIILNG